MYERKKMLTGNSSLRFLTIVSDVLLCLPFRFVVVTQRRVAAETRCVRLITRVCFAYRSHLKRVRSELSLKIAVANRKCQQIDEVLRLICHTMY